MQHPRPRPARAQTQEAGQRHLPRISSQRLSNNHPSQSGSNLNTSVLQREAADYHDNVETAAWIMEILDRIFKMLKAGTMGNGLIQSGYPAAATEEIARSLISSGNVTNAIAVLGQSGQQARDGLLATSIMMVLAGLIGLATLGSSVLRVVLMTKKKSKDRSRKISAFFTRNFGIHFLVCVVALLGGVVGIPSATNTSDNAKYASYFTYACLLIVHGALFGIKKDNSAKIRQAAFIDENDEADASDRESEDDFAIDVVSNHSMAASVQSQRSQSSLRQAGTRAFFDGQSARQSPVMNVALSPRASLYATGEQAAQAFMGVAPAPTLVSNGLNAASPQPTSLAQLSRAGAFELRVDSDDDVLEGSNLGNLQDGDFEGALETEGGKSPLSRARSPSQL